MNPANDRLDRLLRAAATPSAAAESSAQPEPPFGFETRVLATLRAENRSVNPAAFAVVFRRALMCATAVLLCTVSLTYGALSNCVTLLREPEVQAARLTDGAINASVNFAR